MSFVGRQLIQAPHGQLEAIYHPATEHAERVALVLHPHPLYGGTMHNKVVYQTAKALEEVGVVTLRFNFRGVGDSSGGHDGGRGGAEDARTALEWLLARQPHAREVLVAGFSFGASVAIRFGCAEPRVRRIISIGTPAGWFDANLLGACTKPIAFIHGARDDVAPLAPLEKLLRELGERPHWQLHVIPDAGHFFENALPELHALVRTIAAEPLA
jgi:alpha/beta superfamily hydrolase